MSQDLLIPKKCLFKNCYKIVLNIDNDQNNQQCKDHQGSESSVISNVVDIISNSSQTISSDNIKTVEIEKGNITKKLYVQKHKSHIYKKRLNCLHEGCQRFAKYNYKYNPEMQCSQHKLEGMINLRTICYAKECTKRFKFFDEEKKKYCDDHKLAGMKYCRHSRICMFEECQIESPSYNLVGEKIGIQCSRHKLDKMINVMTKLCLYSGCNTQSSFNFKGENKNYCSKHKLKGMVIQKILCKDKNCNKLPFFNFIGLNRKIQCREHKLDNMVNVYIYNKICSFENCDNQSKQNFIRKQIPLYCAEHKLEGMIIRGTNCIHVGCKTRASYNFSEQNEKLQCFSHKLNGMIHNIKKFKRNLNNYKICLVKDCKNISSYHQSGVRKGQCHLHKLNIPLIYKGKQNKIQQRFMKQFQERKKCLHQECEKSANYNFDGEVENRIQCEDHKYKSMINLKQKVNLCLQEFCENQPKQNLVGNSSSSGYCLEHKSFKMIKFKKNKTIAINCSIEGCNEKPLQNQEGEKTGIFCYLHKINRMKHIYYKNNCAIKSCFNKPAYQDVNDKKYKYCFVHKLDGMTTLLSLKNNICIVSNCVNTPMQKDIKNYQCMEHKTKDSTNIQNNKLLLVSEKVIKKNELQSNNMSIDRIKNFWGSTKQ